MSSKPRPISRRSGRWRSVRWRAVVRLAVLLALVVLLCISAGFSTYVRPQLDPLQKADAIVVLGGLHDGREKLGFQLAAQGYAPQVVISNPYGPQDTDMEAVCTMQMAFAVRCFAPQPATTSGEALEIRRRAQAEGWHRIIVITFRPHISRARYIVQRCTGLDVTMVASDPQIAPVYWVRMYLYQTLGYLKTTVDHTCDGAG